MQRPFCKAQLYQHNEKHHISHKKSQQKVGLRSMAKRQQRGSEVGSVTIHPDLEDQTHGDCKERYLSVAGLSPSPFTL